jgi:hypothetical protein
VYLSVAVGEGKAQIWIGAEAWVDAKEIAGAYRSAQQQLISDNKRKIPTHHLEAFRFVRRQTRRYGSRPSWARLWALWNEQHPERPYKQRNGLFQAFKEASVRLMRPKYDRPKWKRRDAS